MRCPEQQTSGTGARFLAILFSFLILLPGCGGGSSGTGGESTSYIGRILTPDGLPAAGARIEGVTAGGEARGVTDENGFYEFSIPTPEGVPEIEIMFTVAFQGRVFGPEIRTVPSLSVIETNLMLEEPDGLNVIEKNQNSSGSEDPVIDKPSAKKDDSGSSESEPGPEPKPTPPSTETLTIGGSVTAVGAALPPSGLWMEVTVPGSRRFTTEIGSNGNWKFRIRADFGAIRGELLRLRIHDVDGTTIFATTSGRITQRPQLRTQNNIQLSRDHSRRLPPPPPRKRRRTDGDVDRTDRVGDAGGQDGGNPGTGPNLR